VGARIEDGDHLDRQSCETKFSMIVATATAARALRAQRECAGSLRKVEARADTAIHTAGIDLSSALCHIVILEACLREFQVYESLAFWQKDHRPSPFPSRSLPPFL